jgi:hypothetical protein
VLENAAKELIAELGYDDPPRDSLFGFRPNAHFLDHLREEAREGGDYEAVGEVQPAALRFIYRQSPELLTPSNTGGYLVWNDEPPHVTPGMIRVELDADGRLAGLSVVPTPIEDEVAAEPDWNLLLDAAGFDPATLTPVAPTRIPPVFADTRAAWEGVYSDAPEIPVRLEAAAYRGKPVAFEIVEPWTPLPGVRTDAGEPGFGGIVGGAMFLLILLLAALVAARNVRLGRGDRRTALRFGLYLAGVRMLWLVNAHHVPSEDEIGIILANGAWATWRLCLVYVLYLAVEPYARRVWPHMLTSWVRLARGNLADPRVGRDLLLGLVGGGVFFTVARVSAIVVEASGLTSVPPEVSEMQAEALRGFRGAFLSLVAGHTESMLTILSLVMLLLFLRMILRKTWIAIVAFWVLAMIGGSPEEMPFAIHLVTGTILVALQLAILFRVGFLAYIAAFTIAGMLEALPLTFAFTSWYGTVTPLALIVVLGMGIWGFWTSLAGRPLFAEDG